MTLRFLESLDRGLLEGMLLVLDRRDQPVAGRVVIPPGEREWRFYPRRGWSEGEFRVRVQTDLEDVAGNSLRRAFETALDASAHEPAEPRFLDLSFRFRG